MNQYTCNEYRQEMILAGLRRQLAREDLDEDQKRRLITEIRQLEKEMRMD